MFIMVWICCVEIFMFIDCVYMVRHPISQTSGVKILPLARMERGFVSKSGAGDAEFIFLLLKSLVMVGWIL